MLSDEGFPRFVVWRDLGGLDLKRTNLMNTRRRLWQQQEESQACAQWRTLEGSQSPLSDQSGTSSLAFLFQEWSSSKQDVLACSWNGASFPSSPFCQLSLEGSKDCTSRQKGSCLKDSQDLHRRIAIFCTGFTQSHDESPHLCNFQSWKMTQLYVS